MKCLIQTIGAIVMATLHVLPSTAAEIEVVNPKTLYNPAPNGYSHAVLAKNVDQLVFIAGQGGEASNGLLPPDFEAQVAQAYQNLATVLETLGASPNQVVRLHTYVVDHEQSKLDILTRHLVALFGDHLPAQTLVPVPRLALDGMLFEVDATVVIGSGDQLR